MSAAFLTVQAHIEYRIESFEWYLSYFLLVDDFSLNHIDSADRVS